MLDHGPLRSSSVLLTADQQGETVDLVMTDQLTRVELGFEGGFRLRGATIGWMGGTDTDTDTDVGIEHFARVASANPFTIWLPPGQYQLRAHPAGGEGNGRFLLPVARWVRVGTNPLDVWPPAEFGGTFTLLVRDGNGERISGRCRVVTAEGRCCRQPFRDNGSQTDRFRSDEPACFDGAVPPGVITLVIDTDAGVERRHTVTIGAMCATDVLVRLP